MITSPNIIRALSSLFFPEICYACGSDLVGRDQLLCLRCIHQLPYTKFERFQGNPIEKIFWGRIPIEHAASILYFTKNSVVEKLLYQLKYRGKQEVGLYLGRLMGLAIKEACPFSGCDIMVPLPLFRKKEHQRGFNQAKLLCDGISAMLSIPISLNAVERVEATETQTRKNRVERWLNMQQRFQLKEASLITNKHVLLVDDVITTGATMESCALEILKGSGVKVSILTLAYSSSKNV